MSVGRRNQRVGQAVQRIAAMRLIYLGFQMVLQVATPMAKIQGRWMHCGKVEGDIRAVGPAGVSVLCEVKSRNPGESGNPRLTFTDFEDHQVRRLDQHRDLGAISLVAWHYPGSLHILPWDLMRSAGFGKDHGIGVEWALANEYKRGQIAPMRHQKIISKILPGETLADHGITVIPNRPSPLSGTSDGP